MIPSGFRRFALGVLGVASMAAGGSEIPLSLVPTAAPQVAAANGSREPRLHSGADGRLYLSWLEPGYDGEFAFRFAVMGPSGWSSPRTVARGKDWFVNWSDYPSLIAHADGTLVAHWLVANGGASYEYDVNIAFSRDGGDTWSRPVAPHRDGTQTQHGFVTLLAWAQTQTFAVWLDGRETHTNGNMTLRYALLDREGAPSQSGLLDARTCTCCQTAAALAGDELLVAYRDRGADEVRDIAIVRFADARWSAPAKVHDDRWVIAGCPINGPALAADGARVAVAWFTLAQGTARVNLAFSGDGARTFSAPLRVDDGDPLGRVDVALMVDGSALVSWLEQTGDGEEVRLRRASPDGSVSPGLSVARATSGRTTGFPSLALHGGKAWLAWTQARALGIRAAAFEPGDR